MKKIQNADLWLETRAIDSHRANSRLLKKALRLVEKDDISTVIHVNGATITDNYWIREIGSNLTYNDVKFSDNSSLTAKDVAFSYNKAKELGEGADLSSMVEAKADGNKVVFTLNKSDSTFINKLN